MSSVTNSPAGLMNIVQNNSSPHSSTGLLNNNHTTNSPHRNSPPSGDELNTQLNAQQLNENNNLMNHTTRSSGENGLNQLVLNNQSPHHHSNNSSPLSKSNNILNKCDQEMKNQESIKFSEMYQQNDSTLNALIPNSTTQTNNQNNLSPNSSIKMNVKSDSNDNSSNLAQQTLTTSSAQWTGTQTTANNFPSGRYQSTVQNTSPYQTNQFGPGNQSSINSSALNLNSPNQLTNNTGSISSPYLDYNLNTSYTGSMLNQPVSQASSCSVPTMNSVNMFTAAAIAANSSKSSNSDSFPFSNNSLNKKYLNLQQDASMQSNLHPPTSDNVLDSSLDQTLFYGSNGTTNGSTPLSKSTTLQSSLVKPHQNTPEFSASLANNYANFAPNSNAYNWQPGSAQQQLGMTNGSSMYQAKQIQMQQNLQHQLHHAPSGHDEASPGQASTPNSQLDELRSDTPNTKLNSQTNGQTYLTSAINGVSNNSSSNSSTGSMASSANSSTNSLNGKGMPVYSFPPTPNTIGSPGASVMSGFYEEFEPAPTTWSKSSRLDGLLKLYEISNEPGRKIFLDKLISFNEERGCSINSCPTINKTMIDLYRFYLIVKERGGFQATTKNKLWKEISTLLNIKHQQTNPYILRKQYIKHLLPFECKFDLNGADIEAVVASTENANRKKRKNKAGEQSAPITTGMSAVNNSLNVSNNNQSMNGVSGGKEQLPPINSISSNQPGTNLHQSLNQLSNRPPPHLTMQQSNYPPTNSLTNNSANNMTNSIVNNGVMSNASFQQQPAQSGGPGYNYATNSNYNGVSNYTNGSSNLYPANSMYNQSIDYQGKLNHQLSAAQQAQFFANSNSQIMNANQAGLVNSSIQANAHNNLPPNALTSNQQQFYTQSTGNAMYGNVLNGSTTNGNLIGGQTTGDFYTNANYATNLVHNAGNTIYSNSNQQINTLNGLSQYGEEMMIKYGNASRANSEQLNNTQSSLTSTNQLNSSNNNQYYNGHADPTSNYTSSIYSRPTNGYQQMNGYSNAMLDNSALSNTFDSKNSNLIDFHSSIKSTSDPTSNLDTYLSDPYAYEPESKRFHAMSNC